MKLTCISIVLSTCFFSSNVFSALEHQYSLMPWPKKIVQPTMNGFLSIDRRLTINTVGDDLNEVTDYFRLRLSNQTGWTLEPQQKIEGHAKVNIIVLQKVGIVPLPDSDESYKLSVGTEGVTLTANTRFGAMRGIETLLQMVKSGAGDAKIPYVSIEDQPRFPWRGVLLDSARHFMPLDDIKRQIDGMSAAKINVFHWHLTDDQGWRFESKTHPKLQEKASDGLFYTQEQMREIVLYAAKRGVRVVPEVDMPGHASAIAVAYPELISAPGDYKMERHWGVLKPILDPTKEETYAFAEAIISELVKIFPDPYLHIGGDEVEGSQWQENTEIQTFMKEHGLADNNALQAYFNRKVAALLKKYDRHMVGWDEIYHPDLPKDILIHSWQGQDALGKVAKEGGKGILSTGFYLDQPQYTSYHYRNEIIPQGLGGVDVAKTGDKIQSWSLEMPRLKGSTVQGTFTLIENDNKWRGFIDFKNKSRRVVNDIKWTDTNQVSFKLDTWMGPTQPVLDISGDKFSGYILVGNVRYPATGQRLNSVPQGIPPVIPDKGQDKNLLGGEVALWAENVIPAVLDIKLWPRTFAVAERLWSAPDVKNIEDMYQRLEEVDKWSTVSVGLQQHTQQIVQFFRLANDADVIPLQILAQALEPAHYYTRHHLKFKAGNYHQFEPLNLLADALPAESQVVLEMNRLVDTFTQRRDSKSADNLRNIFNRWSDNVSDVLRMADKSDQMKSLRPVIRKVERVSDIGLRLTDLLTAGKKLNREEYGIIKNFLNEAAGIDQEIVIAAVVPVEKLLMALSNK